MAVSIDELKQDVHNAFNTDKAFKECNNKELYIILVNGKRVTLKTGKNVWSGPGGAKNALRNHLHNLFWKFRQMFNQRYQVLDGDGKPSCQLFRDTVRAAEDEWIAQHVVYIPLSTYSVAASKMNKTKGKK